MGGGAAEAVQEVARRCREEWPRGSFLAGLRAEVLADFLGAGELVQFRKGEALIHEGGPARHAFLLLNAMVKATARVAEGRHALLAVRVGGDVVGEVAVMDGGTRTATVTACRHEPTIAVRVRGGDLRVLLGRHPDAAISLASVISRKLRTATRRRIDITGCPPKVRIARVLLEMAEDHGHSGQRGTFLGINITRAELGSLVGIGQSTVERAFRELKHDGLIDSPGRGVLVPDMALLRAAASLD